MHYELLDSEEFPLPPLVPAVPSLTETHVSYPPSPIPNNDNEFPDDDWPSDPPTPSSNNSDHVPVLQAFIETVDDLIEACIRDTNLVHDMALVLYEGSQQMDVAQMNAIADEEYATPMPTGPQPDVFPGPGWMDNWTETGTRHFFLIPHGKEVCIAPFIQYNFDMPYPELLATHGKGCTVHSRPLHARGSENDAVVGYAPHEEWMFFEDEEHTEVVNWAMWQEEDPTLQGELQYLHTHCLAALRTAHWIAKL